jgi:hypothetical protein
MVRQAGGRGLLGVLLVLTMSCATGATAPQPGSAAAWERMVDGLFEHRGVGKIERIGSRWALTVLCTGTHSTYLDDTTLDLPSYDKRFVRARYRWVDRTIPDPRCVKAPCRAVTERRISLEKVTVVDVTPEQAAESTRACSTVTPRARGQRALFAR